MKIALCDNDKRFLRALEEMLKDYSVKKNAEMDLDFFSGGEELLAKKKSGERYDIIFMDIYLAPDGARLNGIDTIRSLDLSKNTQVVFTTTSREHAIEAFNLDAAHYLLKPLDKKDVEEAMERCLERFDRSGVRVSPILEIKTRQSLVSIPAENIIYIEVCDKICKIYMENNCIQTYSSLDSLSESLDPAVFMRAQRSFIVNMKYIEAFQYDHLLLANGKEIMISRKTKAELKEQYQKFLFDLARRGRL